MEMFEGKSLKNGSFVIAMFGYRRVGLFPHASTGIPSLPLWSKTEHPHIQILLLFWESKLVIQCSGYVKHQYPDNYVSCLEPKTLGNEIVVCLSSFQFGFRSPGEEATKYHH